MMSEEGRWKREEWPCGNLLDGLDGREDATAQDEEVWLSIDYNRHNRHNRHDRLDRLNRLDREDSITKA